MEKKSKLIKISLPRTERAIHSAIVVGAASRKALTRVIQGKYEYMKVKIRTPSAVPKTLGVTGPGKEEDLRPFVDVLKEILSSPVADLPVTKDIGRLAKRVEIIEESTGKEIFIGKAVSDELILSITSSKSAAVDISSSSSSSSSKITLTREEEQKVTVEVIIKMILALVGIVEPERLSDIEDKLRNTVLAKFSGTSDIILLCEEIITTLGGDSSPTVCALKTVQQEIVLHCTYALKEQITKKYFTKDVRTPDGWRIMIVKTSQNLQISHIRKEQSLDQFGDSKNHWEYQWELKMLFPFSMEKLETAQLRVTDLFLSETMDKSLEDDLKKTIVGDVIIA